MGSGGSPLFVVAALWGFYCIVLQLIVMFRGRPVRWFIPGVDLGIGPCSSGDSQGLGTRVETW